nr:dehydrodolichyl diphosphate synthase 2 [Tanacetum cinerariifolium]
ASYTQTATMAERSEIDLSNIPAHLAVIMDGNGRWAKQRGGLRVFGHQSAITAVRDTVEEAAELGIKYLTLYAFSTENWNRPALEVTALMQLLVHTIRNETPPHDAGAGPELQRPLGPYAGQPPPGRRRGRRSPPARGRDRSHHYGLLGYGRDARPRIAHSHQRRAAHQQLFAVAAGLYRIIHHPCAVARFSAQPPPRCPGSLPAARAPLWQNQ